ncbi:MAG: hypothetical protein QG635_1596, partial [Bacteroidota bacterium]|nr:hypothetical protein [Bacteroidota bacterium]
MNPRIPFRIDVSLDGFEDTHNFIRQNKFLFKKAIETINQLKILRKKYSHFDLSIITTLSKFNQNEIVKFADFIEELLPDGEWMVNIARPKTRDPEAVNFDIESYEKINIILLNRIKNKNFAGDNAHRFGKWLTAKNAYRRDIITDILKNKNVKMNCSAGSLIGVIYQDGEVRPCETLPDSFGNLRDFDYSLSKIWNSPSAKNFRRKIREDNCVCTHECFLSTSILSNYSSIIGLIKKRHSLEM